ncbi:MAG: hypothetical protein CSB24_01895 [Deltaproteobacteria bacterium]|nr:MAG: hypothetical protein CSB24_01895 [Deltaproteobacteria bacterium]
MLSINDAVARIKENIPAHTIEKIRVNDSLGRYLAEDITAPEASPRYTSSAMDGFGLRFDAGLGEGTAFEIIGESAAGSSFAGEVLPGQAVRINTGAMIPKGVDTVVRMENTREENGKVILSKLPKKGQDIRHAGEEFAAGKVILSQKTKLSATHLALLNAVGIEEIAVYKPCTVSILVTGSELVSSGESIAPDQIRDSNMIMLAAAITEAGGVVVETRRVPDNEKQTRKAIDTSKGGIVICTGGISVGRHDHVRASAKESGFDEIFWRIKQKPGKPLFFARRGGQLLFGLPGNPVSAFMCFIHYIKPLIGAVHGLPFGWPVVSAKAVAPIQNNGKRPTMVRVCLDWQDAEGYSITGAEKQGSHMLTSVTGSNGYIILEPEEEIKAGESTTVYRYDSGRDSISLSDFR